MATTVSRRTRELTGTVDGEERDATWKEGVGIYVDGFGFGKGDTMRARALGTSAPETKLCLDSCGIVLRRGSRVTGDEIMGMRRMHM